MNKRALEMIKAQKHYYRDLYRRVVVLTIISCSISLLLYVVIGYQYLTRGHSNYYASNAAGAGFVTRLSPLDGPNTSSVPLLKPDPPEEINQKQPPKLPSGTQ